MFKYIPEIVNSDHWLKIRWDDSRPENDHRGKSHPHESYESSIDRERHSERGIKQYHRMKWRMIFRSIHIPREMRDYFERRG